ncbi:MAG: hypothetical protein KDD62_05200, partial [Bdellovibrionales bacterium]|nr:hypothetical protein [Bdellovibrionales bacterium]
FQHHLVRRAKERICAAALAFHKTPSHNVSVNFRDTDQVFQDASLAYQQFGFLRMWSIYPTHVAAITRAMTPQTAVLELATQVLLLGQKSEWGPTSYEDRLHDRASYRYYWSILKRTKALGGIIPDAAQRAFF